MEEKEITKKYPKEDLTVIWQPKKCIHSGICVSGLGSVFRPTKKPWINTTTASKEDIMKQIDQCPSGALSYELEGQESDDTLSTVSAKVRINAGASILIQGPMEITLPDGSTEQKDRAASFCRCGASQNKPYCDGSHRGLEFDR